MHNTRYSWYPHQSSANTVMENAELPIYRNGSMRFLIIINIDAQCPLHDEYDEYSILSCYVHIFCNRRENTALTITM